MPARSLRILVGLLAVCGSLHAQLLAATVTPNPAAPGVAVTLAVRDAWSLGLQLPTTCLIRNVTSGGPQSLGTVVWTSGPCGDALTPLPTCSASAPMIDTWNQLDASGLGVPPGDYWINVDLLVPGVGLRRESFALTVQATPLRPTLSVLFAPSGGVMVQQIISPGDPGANYVLAASGSTNVGFGLTSSRFALDPDPILTWSLNPNVALVNFQGQLDASGSGPAATLYFAQAPALSCLPLKLQAVVLPIYGLAPKPTNCLHMVFP